MIMRKRRRINVRKHKRRLKSGNATIVRKHHRSLKQPRRIERKCWQCQQPLDFEEYIQSNPEEPYEKLKDVWDSISVELFCCRCFAEQNLLNEFQKSFSLEEQEIIKLLISKEKLDNYRFEDFIFEERSSSFPIEPKTIHLYFEKFSYSDGLEIRQYQIFENELAANQMATFEFIDKNYDLNKFIANVPGKFQDYIIKENLIGFLLNKFQEVESDREELIYLGQKELGDKIYNLTEKKIKEDPYFAFNLYKDIDWFDFFELESVIDYPKLVKAIGDAGGRKKYLSVDNNEIILPEGYHAYFHWKNHPIK